MTKGEREGALVSDGERGGQVSGASHSNNHRLTVEQLFSADEKKTKLESEKRKERSEA